MTTIEKMIRTLLNRHGTVIKDILNKSVSREKSSLLYKELQRPRGVSFCENIPKLFPSRNNSRKVQDFSFKKSFMYDVWLE